MFVHEFALHSLLFFSFRLHCALHADAHRGWFANCALLWGILLENEKMSSERAIPKIFETYSHLMEPVFDESGVLKAASFMFEDNVQISTQHGMSNVKQHLADHYAVFLTPEDKEAICSRKRRRVSSRDNETGQTDLHFGDLLDMAALLARVCALGALPLSFMQNPGIQLLVRSLNRHVTMPCPSTVTKSIDELYESMIRKVKTDVASARGSDFGPVRGAVCTDLWTSISKNGHLGLNLRVLDPKFNMCNFTLGCPPLSCPHTGPRIAGTVLSVLSSFGMTGENLVAVTTDNGSSALSASQFISGGSVPLSDVPPTP